MIVTKYFEMMEISKCVQVIGMKFFEMMEIKCF